MRKELARDILWNFCKEKTKEKPSFWVLILGFVIGMGTMYLFRYSKSSL